MFPLSPSASRVCDGLSTTQYLHGADVTNATSADRRQCGGEIVKQIAPRNWRNRRQRSRGEGAETSLDGNRALPSHCPLCRLKPAIFHDERPPLQRARPSPSGDGPRWAWVSPEVTPSLPVPSLAQSVGKRSVREVAATKSTSLRGNIRYDLL